MKDFKCFRVLKVVSVMLIRTPDDLVNVIIISVKGCTIIQMNQNRSFSSSPLSV